MIFKCDIVILRYSLRYSGYLTHLSLVAEGAVDNPLAAPTPDTKGEDSEEEVYDPLASVAAMDPLSANASASMKTTLS